MAWPATSVMGLAVALTGDRHAVSVLDHSPAPGSVSGVLGIPSCVDGVDFDNIGPAPGFVSVAFEAPVADGPGDDVFVHLTGFQPNQTFVEDFDMLATFDGTNYVSIGSANPNDFSFGPLDEIALGFDLAAGGLSEALAVRVQNRQVFFQTSSEGPDICGFSSPHVGVRLAVDIKPGSDPNSVRLKPRGKLPVAILNDGRFDPAAIDVSLLTIGDGEGIETPVARRRNGTQMASLEDADGDGDVDLVLHFEKAELIANGDLTSNTEHLVLTAFIEPLGRAIGFDAVRIR